MITWTCPSMDMFHWLCWVMEWWNSRWLQSEPGIKQNNPHTHSKKEERTRMRGKCSRKGGQEKKEGNDEEILLLPFIKIKSHSNAHHCYRRVSNATKKKKKKKKLKITNYTKNQKELTASFLIGSIKAVVDAIATLIQIDALTARFARNVTVVWSQFRRWYWTNGGTWRWPTVPHPAEREIKSKSNRVKKTNTTSITNTSGNSDFIPSTTRKVNPSDST